MTVEKDPSVLLSNNTEPVTSASELEINPPTPEKLSNDRDIVIETTQVLPKLPEKEMIHFSQEIKGELGKELTLELDKEGWIYKGADSPSVKMKIREFTGEKTRFRFVIEDLGSFVLSFYLQNVQSGEEVNAEYSVLVDMPSQSESRPVIIEPNFEDKIEETLSETEKDILKAVEEENIPEIVASFDQLLAGDKQIESSVLEDVFTQLEKQGGYDQYLISLAEKVYSLYPYDNLSAQLLYKAALNIEKPGPGQDVEKAVSLFKLVRDHFPISIYCDKSEERIRYLERHFMKIY